MRKMVLTRVISLDGVIEGPNWTSPFWNDEIAQIQI